MREDVGRLTTEFSHLEPLKQRRLLADIGQQISDFVAKPDLLRDPGEGEVFVKQVGVLASNPVGALRLFDKKTRHNVKQAFEALEASPDPAMAGIGKQGLAQMIPDFVRSDIGAEEASTLLEKSEVGNFLVRSVGYPKEEFCVDLKTADGVKHYALLEKPAENGAVLYTFDGIRRYTNLTSLVEKELKGSRGFAFAGEKPDKALTDKAQQEYIQPGTKFDKTRIGDVKVSHIRGSDGHEYIISNTQGQGAFGKFRYALDEEGTRWAVKEFRSEHARHKHRPKTNITNLEAITDEIATMSKIGVDFTIRDSINIDGKVYAVMPIMEGELGDEVSNIPRDRRRVIARSAFRQMASDLRECHKKGYVHRDVKLANVLWSRRGKIAVSDFGLAAIRPKGKERLDDVAGTPGYMAPEIFDGKGYSVKVDTWSLGISIADILVDWWDSPFVPPRGERIMDWCPENFKAYSRWRGALMKKDGKVDMDLVGKNKTPFDKYFRKLKSADPALCEYLLENILVTNSGHRSMLKDVAGFCDQLQGAGSDAEKLARSTFRKLAGDSADRDAVFDLLDKERLVSQKP